MHKTIKLALTAATPVLLLAGCSDFLKGPGLTTNPNLPVTANADQLWVGIQVAVMAQYENYPWTELMTWAQGLAGVNRQWQTYAEYGSGTDQTSSEAAWNQTYGPGGLRDILTVDSILTANGNLMWRGELRVVEALYMGTAADVFGNVPFSDAGITGITQPTYDTQADVYAHVLALLDSAITDLGGGGTPPTYDFFYNNDAPSWIRVAHTLKARYLMHTAPTSATAYNAANLTAIIAEANLGIQEGGDFKPLHTGAPGEQNLFYAFQFSRAGDIAPAGTHIIETKNAGETSILPRWYTPPNDTTAIYGACAGALSSGPVVCDNVVKPLDSMAIFEVTNDPAAEWPFISFAENEMLKAEATLLNGGGVANALNILNAYRATADGGCGLCAALATGSAITAQKWILREKFVHGFFSIEPWNDYLRTCYPNVPQPLGVVPTADYVPGRMPVGQQEQNTNPNVTAQYNGINPMNANNFNHAKELDGVTDCTEQKNMPTKPAW